jgi:2-dehydro-3-deoxy-D-arabinonate dehydratase
MAAGSWDELVNRDDLLAFLSDEVANRLPEEDLLPDRIPGLEAPLGSQEVWGAGVTYHRSREARMDESRAAGGSDFYSQVYEAERPEIFFKASAHRVAGHGQGVRVRRDSSWTVPEPELALLVTSSGAIVGYSIGNDMSARDLEGENPLYLPQAKTYDGCCALGPGILATDGMLPPSTAVRLEVVREGHLTVEESTTLARMKRTPEELVAYLTRECSFPTGCVLLTGTGIVPDPDFSLRSGDEIRIGIEPIGTLVNTVL